MAGKSWGNAVGPPVLGPFLVYLRKEQECTLHAHRPSACWDSLEAGRHHCVDAICRATGTSSVVEFLEPPQTVHLLLYMLTLSCCLSLLAPASPFQDGEFKSSFGLLCDSGFRAIQSMHSFQGPSAQEHLLPAGAGPHGNAVPVPGQVSTSRTAVRLLAHVMPCFKITTGGGSLPCLLSNVVLGFKPAIPLPF